MVDLVVVSAAAGLRPGDTDGLVSFALDPVSAAEVRAWQANPELPLPAEVSVDWQNHECPLPDLVCAGSQLFASTAARRQLAAGLDGFGHWVPALTLNEPTGYSLFLAGTLVDCLDTHRTSPPIQRNGLIDRPCFRPDAVDPRVPVFRVPEYPHATLWSAETVTGFAAAGCTGVQPRLIWSTDPARSTAMWRVR